jgi:hypothetical protein
MECELRGAVAYYERDGKNWDATMQEMHAQLRVSIYACLDPELAAFAQRCMHVRGKFRRGPDVFEYMLRWTVKSGHSDTTLGNTLVNLAIAAAAFTAAGVRASVIAAGDDLLVACYSDYDADVIARAEARMGIVPEYRKFTTVEDCSFVSGVFLRARDVLWFVPKLGRLMSRLWWTVTPPAPRHRAAFMRGVSRGLWLVSELPVYRRLLFDSPGNAVKLRPRVHFLGDPLRPFGDALSALARRYDVTPQALLALDAHLADLTSRPAFVVNDLATHIIRCDCCEISDRAKHCC